MIEFNASDNDDVGFLSRVQRIVNGAVVALRVREVYLVHIDNWFDHKWLGWRSRSGEEPRVPPFSPNRVCSEEHLMWDADGLRWGAVAQQRPLRVLQSGRP